MATTLQRPTERQPPARASERARRRAELTRTDRAIRGVLLVAAIIPTFALGFLAYQMVKSAYPAIIFNGWKFFTTRTFTLGNLYGGADEVRHGYHGAHGAQY